MLAHFTLAMRSQGCASGLGPRSRKRNVVALVRGGVGLPLQLESETVQRVPALGGRGLRALWPFAAGGDGHSTLSACSIEAAAAKAYEPVLGAVLADMRGQVLALCQQIRARRILDVCCGPAGLTRQLAHAGLEVCGVDLSWPMLRQARKHCGGVALHFGQAPLFVRADATALPFASAPARSGVATALPFASAPARSGVATALPFAPALSGDATAPFDAAVLTLALHTMPPAIGHAAVAEMLRVASYAIVADYRLAERNCDLPAVTLGRAVEWLVGGEHYACYKAFMAAGGLEGFARSHGYAPLERRRILGGAGTIMVLKAGA